MNSQAKIMTSCTKMSHGGPWIQKDGWDTGADFHMT